MTAYYNEIDPFAAQWLRNLIARGLIAPGDVDERSVSDVRPADLAGYVQCHFFAGIGGWSYALRLAGWPDDRPVWTGSCPCQPFSVAGKGLGTADERHLWPDWFWLIAQCRPGVVFGEQVEAAIGHGWLDLVQTDLEGEGYAFGAVGIPAAGVGAPHGRHRCWFVADIEGNRWSGRQNHENEGWRERASGYHGATSLVADDQCNSRGSRWPAIEPGESTRAARTGAPIESGRRSDGGVVGNNNNTRPQGLLIGRHGAGERAARETGVAGFWSDCEWIYCRDEKYRPVEPGTFPLAHGVAARMVYTCATCQTETIVDENMRIVRRFAQGYEGLCASALLFDEVLRQVDHRSSDNTGERALSGAIQICRDLVREMRESPIFGSSPHRRQRDEQRAVEYRNSLPEMSRSRAPSYSDSGVQGLQHGVSGSPLAEQHLFCVVCARMGTHLRSEEVGSRVGKLRAYGNAIVPQVAEEVIRAYMECAP